MRLIRPLRGQKRLDYLWWSLCYEISLFIFASWKWISFIGYFEVWSWFPLSYLWKILTNSCTSYPHPPPLKKRVRKYKISFTVFKVWNHCKRKIISVSRCLLWTVQDTVNVGTETAAALKAQVCNFSALKKWIPWKFIKSYQI